MAPVRTVIKSHKNEPRCSSDPSVIFFIPELLQVIHLNLNMHTLLISTRVCSTWKDLITNSRKIQQALFYIPVEPQQKSRKNPLVVEKIWSEFIYTTLDSRYRLGGDICGWRNYPHIASEEREEAYLRPEASWRRMLLQQPPTSIVRFWNPEHLDKPYEHRWDYGQGFKTGDRWMPNKDYIRMENIEYWIDTKALTAGPLPFLCWADPDNLRKFLRQPGATLRADRTLQQFLSKFDLSQYAMPLPLDGRLG